MCFVDDLYLDVPFRSKSGCGPTNDQAVDSPHNVLPSNAFPDNVLTNAFPNLLRRFVIIQNICIVLPGHFLEAGQPEGQHGFWPGRRLEEDLVTANLMLE